jgi:hypothetical protein
MPANTGPQPDVLREVEDALVGVLGSVPARASVSFVGVEPIDVLRFSSAGVTTLVTSGMARRPMAGADQLTITEGPRAELMLQLRGEVDDAWRRLAVLAAAPVVEGVVYRPGMTVDLGEAIGGSSRCTGGVVAESALPPIDTAAGPVDVLRVLPATAAELAWARARGTAALVERWDSAGVDLLDLGRAAVSLG